MKSLLIIIFVALFGSLSFAGYDNSSTTICDNGDYQIKIKRKGSFFGENQIRLKESDSFFGSIVNEEYVQDWSPEGQFEAEALAKKEMPVATRDFYTLLIAPSVVVVQVFPNGTSGMETGERSTFYVQLKENFEMIKFDVQSQCQKSEGF